MRMRREKEDDILKLSFPQVCKDILKYIYQCYYHISKENKYAMLPYNHRKNLNNNSVHT